jgi:DNA-binding transcriptional MerR regulator
MQKASCLVFWPVRLTFFISLTYVSPFRIVAVYSIKDLEQLTGIKAHTIRIWEQRYDIVNPKRTQTNIRYYTDEDLKQLLNIALLNKNGYKISKIATMRPNEINELVYKVSGTKENDQDIQLDTLTIAMIEMDEFKFEQVVSAYIRKYGFEQMVVDIIQPFLEKLGILWLTGSIKPAQEHFISYLIRRKVMVAIDQLAPVQNPNAPKWVLFLPEGEHQELTLLFMHYFLKSHGQKVIYLGLDIPSEDIEAVYQIHKPEFVFTILSEAFHKRSVDQFITQLAQYIPNSTLMLSGYHVMSRNITLPANAKVLASMEDAIEFVSQGSSVTN